MRPWWHWLNLIWSHIAASYLSVPVFLACVWMDHHGSIGMPFVALSLAAAVTAPTMLLLELTLSPAPFSGSEIGVFVVVYLAAFVSRSIYSQRPKRRKPSGFCTACGYNLRGNVSGICPECGTPTPARH